MTRQEFIQNRDYLISKIQLGILNLIGNYKDKRKLKDYQLAEELGVSKGYVSQILNASVDHKISKIVDLSLACQSVPMIFFVPIEEYLSADQQNKVFDILPIQRPLAVVYANRINSSIVDPHVKKVLVDNLQETQITAKETQHSYS